MPIPYTQVAAKIAGLERDGEAREGLLALLAAKDSPPHLRRVAAEALGRIADRRAVPALLAAAAADPADRFLEHALIYALIEIGDATGTAEGLREDRPVATRRAAMIALSEMSGDALAAASVIPLLASTDPVLKETALWVARRHASWGGDLAGYFRQRLEAPATPETERAELETLLAGMARESIVQQMAVAILRDGKTPAQTTILRAMARAEITAIPEPWIDEVLRILAAKNPDLIRDAIAAANRFVPRKEGARLTAPLLALARDAANPEDVRVAALTALPAGVIPPEAVIFDLLRNQLDRAEPAATRTAAAASLSRAKLDDTQRGALIDLLPQLGPLEFARLLPAFDRALPESLGRRLLDALRNTPALSAGQPQALRATFAKLPASLQPDAEKILAMLNLDSAQQRVKLDAIAAELPAGDIRRGQSVFNNAKTACTVCHADRLPGGKLRPGPHLDRPGAQRARPARSRCLFQRDLRAQLRADGGAAEKRHRADRHRAQREQRRD